MGIGPLDFGDLSRKRDRLLAVKLRIEGVMRESRQSRKGNGQSGGKNERSRSHSDTPHFDVGSKYWEDCSFSWQINSMRSVFNITR